MHAPSVLNTSATHYSYILQFSH